jgi:branched-chain amino acid transport system permease protein
MVIVGGIASILGSIFGAVFLTILPEILGAKYQLYQLILQGVILVLALMFMPFGLSGTFWKVRGWATKRWIKGDVDRQGKELVQSKSK